MYKKGKSGAQPPVSDVRAAEGESADISPAGGGHSSAWAAGPAGHSNDTQERLQESLALVRATLQSAADGILVARRGWSIVDYNDRFVEMWRVPPNLLPADKDRELVAYLLDQVAERDRFVKLIESLQEAPDVEVFEEAHLHDGRIFECYAVPQRVHGKVVGRVWSFRDVTARRQSEQALRASQARLAKAQRIASLGSWEIDLATGQLWASDETYRLLQLGPGGTYSHRVLLSALHPADRRQVRAMLSTVAGGSGYNGQWRVRLRNGKQRIFAVQAELQRDTAGRAIKLIGIFQDITERKLVEGLNARLGRILDSSSNEIYVFAADSLRFVQVNQAARRNLGFGIGKLTQLTPDKIMGIDRTLLEERLQPLRQREVEELVLQTSFIRRDGSRYPVEVRLQLSESEQPAVFVAIVEDITERKRSEAKLRYLANYDSLTGLPNRALFRDRLSQAIDRARRQKGLLAVLFMDLDRFKSVNDTLGHASGDRLLQLAAERIKKCLRASDTLARQGGDEFTVLLGDIGYSEAAASVASKIIRAFDDAFSVEGHQIYSSVSIGITVFPNDADGIDGLLRNADAAMYLAKEQGRSNYQFFTPDMNARAHERLLLESSLRKAQDNGEFTLHYQPQIDLRTGALSGFEALLRWQHPEIGMIPPDTFIPIAEETGMIIPIGEWVLRTACTQWCRWRDAGFAAGTMAINLSVRQFRQADATAMLARVVQETGMDPAQLELELTETTLMTNADISSGILDKLKAVGVRLAVDDFGTGYSSLSYLKRFPIDTLKIDRSFVRDIAIDPDDAAIVEAIVALGHALQITVVAEGVETDAQREFLMRQGCQLAQGYLFGQPLLPKDAVALMEASNPASRRGDASR